MNSPLQKNSRIWGITAKNSNKNFRRYTLKEGPFLKRCSAGLGEKVLLNILGVTLVRGYLVTPLPNISYIKV